MEIFTLTALTLMGRQAGFRSKFGGTVSRPYSLQTSMTTFSPEDYPSFFLFFFYQKKKLRNHNILVPPPTDVWHVFLPLLGGYFTGYQN
jgi:hypothetical protein